jgi:hypothetical protein
VLAGAGLTVGIPVALLIVGTALSDGGKLELLGANDGAKVTCAWQLAASKKFVQLKAQSVLFA